MDFKIIGCILLILVVKHCSGQSGEPLETNISTPTEFSPSVSATCRGDIMTISVTTQQPFYGTIHPKSAGKNPECATFGSGTNTTVLKLNMYAKPEDSDYCGVAYSNKTDERSVQLQVRPHKTLELAEDKLYVVTCGKGIHRDTKTNTSHSIKITFSSSSTPLSTLTYGREYTVKIALTPPSSGIRIRSCIGFESNNTINLFDEAGCPLLDKNVLSAWEYKDSAATAKIYSMFRFPDTRRLNFQCHVLICPKEGCKDQGCGDDRSPIPEDGILVLATTSVTVLEPGEGPEPLTNPDSEDTPCTGLCRYYNLLFWLAIIFGILFIIMILINCFLCSALTCTCTRTELVEKEPSILEDYDPYRSSWTGSQYGDSRYNIGGSQQGHKAREQQQGYSLADSAAGSDHYATVPSRHESRPGSRYSNNLRTAGGGAQNGSPYIIHSNRKL